ncbi:MAG: septal ring lytic transglycosylase RlpA family protein [Bacteroidota bacterium]
MKNPSLLICVLVILVVSVLATGMPNHATIIQTGKASYYGREFEGRRTASGDIFRNSDYTCAHRKFEFGSILKVTNQKNQLSTIVKVNDRGPFVRSRIIDLSEAAARSIGIYQHGLASVKLELLNIIKMTRKLDSTFTCNDVLDCLGNTASLSGYSISLWRSKNLLHILYIANELYLRDEIENVYVVGLGIGENRNYHVVISNLKSKQEASKKIDFFERQGFMIVKPLTAFH